MSTYEIFWDDLTKEARERLADLYHDNVDICPLASIYLEEDEEE